METNRNRGEAMLEIAATPPARQPPIRVLRVWVIPIIVMAVIALLVAAGLYAIDFAPYDGTRTGALGHYLTFNPELITDALPALGMTIVAVLGIVLTVVAIIVQLSSDRYTGVALMFLRDRPGDGPPIADFDRGPRVRWIHALDIAHPGDRYMSLTISFDLDDEDLKHFRDLMKQAKSVAREYDEDEILAATDGLLEDLQEKKLPAFVRDRVASSRPCRRCCGTAASPCRPRSASAS